MYVSMESDIDRRYRAIYMLGYCIITYMATTAILYFPEFIGISLYPDTCFSLVAIAPACLIAIPYLFVLSERTLLQTFFSSFMSQLVLSTCYYFQYFVVGHSSEPPLYLCDITGIVSAIIFGIIASIIGILVRKIKE